MNSTYLSPFDKAILTGLFVGMVATLLCIGYDVFYRNQTGYHLSDYINVSTIIIVVNIVFLVLGAIYYAFIRYKKEDILYMIVFLLLTAVFAFLAGGIHRTNVPLLEKEFHQLFMPMIVLIGLLAAVGIPYLYHSKKFEEHVL